MLELLSGLDTTLAVTLVLSVGFVLAFEFINGFHDTANAVATVIYTQSMKPQTAVMLSGIFNFMGVFFGGLAVAYAIVNLIPTDLLLNINSAQGMVMVFALLSSAILWNLGTWYFGIPASSSHTLIGAILGVGVGNALITGDSLSNGINWGKAIDVFLSLFLSPLFGAGLAGLLLFALLKLRPLSNIHKSPFQRQQIEGRKHPPFWARFMLIVSSMGMSFSHGSNDGQKGVGLVMLVLIALAPAQFVVNLDAEPIQIEHTKIAAVQLKELYQRNQAIIDAKYPASNAHKCDVSKVIDETGDLLSAIGDAKSFQQLPEDKRWTVRTQLICLSDAAKKISKVAGISDVDQKQLKGMQKDLSATTEYAPTWVIVAVALAIGMGTMVGWKRVVNTVGEKIGKQDMTYAQGMSAQIMSAASIGLASAIGAPVSTTQILSSAVAGTMVVNRSGIQMSTVRTILTTWVLTLPVSMGLAIALYYFGMKLFA
ncbi:inorganic phosphate transporter [Vogesella urethralis]|jgi:low-affinity inorganic phosphate transporter|uniref:inorganic phosphate transporter n=1 Tax=Vogesella urethralis TaxID=2592656 RepID=UPI00118520BB|nr:inorganic phosphate transporter [Vogesella urethralis]MEC5208861.1 low-affinity inorganic phosphate transporter [Vogesella perlucida]